MHKILIILFISIFYTGYVSAQQTGINQDPDPQTTGVIPYEMKDREEARTPTIDFTDCSLWTVKANQCEATLYRTKDQLVTAAPYSGKIIYTTKQPKASFDVTLKEPVRMTTEWDCIDFWTFGDHWLWGEPSFTTAMSVYALFKDEKGKMREVNMVQSGYRQLVHKYWFMNHLKLKSTIKAGSVFMGFRFKGNNTDVGSKHTIYLSTGYIYKEDLKPLSFREFPEKLPFPTRPETILPLNKSEKFTNRIIREGNHYTFSYQGDDCELSYELPSGDVLGNITITHDGTQQQQLRGRFIILENGDKAVPDTAEGVLRDDTLFYNCKFRNLSTPNKFSVWYTIKQKSLIMGIQEKTGKGCVKEIHIGEITSPEGKTVSIPFLNFNYTARPYILSDSKLFTFAIFDWYYTNASHYVQGFQDKKTFNLGRIDYIPKTNGERNPVQEKLFINVSPDVWEIFPTIANPPSPMRSLQADRLWDVDGSTDLVGLKNYASQLRARGVEKVSMRYHEGFWREDGESYTFKTTPNPQLTVEAIQKHLEFIKGKDWRVGLYTNYTDFAPVNALFNSDWVKHGPDGEWEVSWSRCYSPKPQIAWEQEAIIAPQIHNIFDPNHVYCDVHTAVSPMSRIDYDYRVPGAAMMRNVIERYGMLLLNERKNYQGPVYSEGANHWWYAGLVDGNYANDNFAALPIFPDFSLLKIHPLQMDAASFDTGKKYLAYALAYGNIGMLAGVSDESVRRYAFLQPIQDEYVMTEVKSILYHNQGKYNNASEAVRNDLLEAPQLYITYNSGLQVYVNFSDTDWSFSVEGETITLPQYGFYVYHPDKNMKSSAYLVSENLLDEVYSEDLYYINTHGAKIDKPLGGEGEYMLKKEKFSWEIISFAASEIIDFDLSLIGLSNYKVRIVPINTHGVKLNERCTDFARRITLQHQPDILKYQIIPVESIP